jgi:hypothetical protein
MPRSEHVPFTSEAPAVQEILSASPLRPAQPHVSAIVCPYEGPSLIMASSDRAIRFWDTATPTESQIISGPELPRDTTLSYR